MFERVTLKIFEKRGGTHDTLFAEQQLKTSKYPSNCILTRTDTSKIGLTKKDTRS